ncbi:MAG: LytTR family DNA-binding domain-containing protein [Bacteroidia bacterium]|nr:LytTR family DNA-binding domain-containing protein [Bacteroidia bacterium]
MVQHHIRTVIIDDEVSFINTLEILLQKHPEFKIIGKARSATEAIHVIKETAPDLVFLDVQLGDGNGFDVLKAIENPDHLDVVFVTAFDEYAVEAFRFSAVDYLLKPVIYDDLVSALDRVKQSIQSRLSINRLEILLANLKLTDNTKKKIVLREADTHHIIDLDDIMWCMAEGSYTSFHLVDDRTIVVSKNLKEYEEILSSNGFYRIHRSYVVNLNKVLRLEKAEGGVLHLQGNHQLPVSTRKREKLSMRLDML